MPTATAPAPQASPSRPAPDELKVWVDGTLLPKSQAAVNVFDHGVLYGDGIFEGIRLYNGRIFEAQAHIDRLFESARAIRLDMHVSRQGWIDAICETARANGFADCYIRAVVTRGAGPLGISPVSCKAPVSYIIADALQLYPRELYDKGMPVVVSSVTRNAPNALSPRIKSLNYLNNILGKFDALDAGVPDAIMLNAQGHVAEATAANLFIVRQGVLATPTLACGILEGVTRNVILMLAGRLGIPAEQRVIPRFDLYIADEIFLTGTGAEVMPVTQVDRRPIGPATSPGTVGPITRKLLAAFHAYARDGKLPQNAD